MDKNTIIGIWNDYENSELVTLEQLKKYCKAASCKYTLEQYLDRRVATNLTRFNYDPLSGKKVDYAEMRKLMQTKPQTVEEEVRQRLYAILDDIVYSDVEIKDGSRIGYDLGLDSLDGVEVMIRIDQEFDVRIPVEDYVNVNTVMDVIKVILTYIDRKE